MGSGSWQALDETFLPNVERESVGVGTHAEWVNSRANLSADGSLVNYNETYRSNVRHKPQTLPLYLMI